MSAWSSSVTDREDAEEPLAMPILWQIGGSSTRRNQPSRLLQAITSDLVASATPPDPPGKFNRRHNRAGRQARPMVRRRRRSVPARSSRFEVPAQANQQSAPA